MSFFESLVLFPEDPILHLPIAFAADPRPNKVNLGIGAYKDSQGLPLVLTSVRDAETNLLKKRYNKEYGPIEGDFQLIQETIDLVFGKGFRESFSGGIFGLQSIGGTGALRIGADFLVQEISKTIFLPSPSWPNHEPIFMRTGLNVQNYRYYDEKGPSLDFSGMCDDFQKMPEKSTVMLQVSCHNPTGIDPTIEQWKELSEIIKQRKLIPFFDFAYQGFGGSVEADAFPVRHFASEGHEMLVASSFSKNFGLYSERVGCLSLLSLKKESARNAGSQMKQLVRTSYSNPPRHGAQVIVEILQSEKLKKDWLDELDAMRLRLHEMRHTLLANLQSKGGSLRNWNSMKNQKGFFSLIGLNLEQVKRLKKDYGIYMPSNGRINMAGINSKNIDYVVDSMISVIQK